MKNIRTKYCLIYILFLVFPSQSFPSELFKKIKIIANSNQALVIGERHGRPESTDLFLKLADSLTQDENCLAVGLEIDSDQNQHMDKVSGIENIQISPIINHGHFKWMLQELIRVSQDRCLKIYGLDLPPRLWNTGISRDQWMATQVEKILKKNPSLPILILSGNFHAVKESLWEDGKDRPSMAEILIREKVTIFSVIQAWDQNNCSESHGVFFWSDSRDAHEMFTDLFSIRSVVLPEDMSVIADAAIKWGCQK